MDIEKKLTIALELSTGVLLNEAANEIKQLRAEITRLSVQQRYKPGTELTYLIKAGRINGFRVIFNRNPKDKEDAARELLQTLRESTGLDYGDDLYDSLIQYVKNIHTDETIS